MGLKMIILVLIAIILTAWVMNNENWDTQYDKFIPKVDAKYLQDIEHEKKYKSGLIHEANIQ